MSSLGSNPYFVAGVITGVVAFYLLPTIIGLIRQVEGLGWLIALNLLLPGIGWLAGMVWALWFPRRRRPARYRPGYYYPPDPGQHW